MNKDKEINILIGKLNEILDSANDIRYTTLQQEIQLQDLAVKIYTTIDYVLMELKDGE
tara:strand:+ start:1064 stop:1237 length:174 start_codon:yes stop_codon:yes gene_type:complete